MQGDWETLLTDAESEHLERKGFLKNNDDAIRQTMAAFANNLSGDGEPGYLVLGLDDDTAQPVGLDITDTLLRRLADFRSDGTILPPPVLHVERVMVRGSLVAVMRVDSSDSPPVRFKGRIYVRVGPTTRLATPEEERRLSEKRRNLNRPFDQQPVPGASLEDLDLQFFKATYLQSAISSQTLLENGRSDIDLLVSSRFLAPGGQTPTVSGLLITGRDPQYFFPGAFVQFVRFAGDDLTAPILNEKKVTGTIYVQARQLDDLLKLQIRVAPKTGPGFRHQKAVDYPLAALREAVINALVHRTYEGTNDPVHIYWFEDRVEIKSPGGLFGQVSQENFGRATDYRNPTLAEAMKNLGYIEQFGIGIQRIYKALQDNGNPVPQFDFSAPQYVLVTIREDGRSATPP